MGQRPGWARVALSCASLLLASLICRPLFAQAGPVGNWKLDEGSGSTTADASGNGHSGTLSSASWVTGRVNGALSFNGTTSTVGINAGNGNLNDLQGTGLSVAAWIKLVAAPASGNNRIVDKDNANVGWFLGVDTARKLQFWSDQFPTVTKRISSGSVSLNTWAHVVVTWTGSPNATNIHFFIDGSASDGTATSATGTAASDASSPFTIGSLPDLTKRLNGSIDEVHVYNRVLALSEIQALADSTPPSSPTNLNATPASSSQINLSWSASTDNVGTASYSIERCAGVSVRLRLMSKRIY